MTLTSTASKVEDYLQEVRAHLSDLSEAESAELTEDLPAHLAEVAAGSEEPLELQLGSPSAFAAELMASAGLGAAAAPSGRRSSLLSRVRTALSLPRWEPLERWRADLRPAWWVARAGLVAGVVGGITSGRDAALSAFPFPVFAGNAAVGLILLVLAVAASVRLGRRAWAPAPGRVKRVDLVASGLVVFFSLMAWSQVNTFTGPYPVQVIGGAESFSSGVLTDANGEPITNIYPYDRAGLLLRDVLLYDQNGRPLANHSHVDAQGRDLITTHDTDVNGAEVHAYPLRQSLAPGWDDTGGYNTGGGRPPVGAPEPVRPPAVVIPPLPAPAEVPEAPATSAGSTPTPETPGSAGSTVTWSKPWWP